MPYLSLRRMVSGNTKRTGVCVCVCVCVCAHVHHVFGEEVIDFNELRDFLVNGTTWILRQKMILGYSEIGSQEAGLIPHT